MNSGTTVGSAPGNGSLDIEGLRAMVKVYISRDHLREVHAMGTAKGMAFMVLTFLCTIGIVFAAQSGASLDRGKALFNDPKLGTSGKTCATCHADGKKLENVAQNSDLAATINGCIAYMLKGTPLDITSVDMQSLVLYVKKIGEQRPAATKKAPSTGY